MPTCPSGHTSESADFCDVCGDLIDGAPRVPLNPIDPADPGGPGPETAPGSVASVPGAAEVCPLCGTPRSGSFCEVDAYPFEAGPATRTGVSGVSGVPPAGEDTGGPAWSVTIIADRAYYDSVIGLGGPDAASIVFPPYAPERRIALRGEQVRIGRRSASRGIEPEIDLSVPPGDPGVSHLHAVLLAQPDGTWTLVDPGSMNGTTLNGATEPLDVNVPAPVGDGDRVHVGAWTTLLLSVRGAPS